MDGARARGVADRVGQARGGVGVARDVAGGGRAGERAASIVGVVAARRRGTLVIGLVLDEAPWVAVPVDATRGRGGVDLVAAALVGDRVVVEHDRLARREVGAPEPALVVVGQRVEHRAVDPEGGDPAEAVEDRLLRRAEPDGAGGVGDRQGVAGDRAVGPVRRVAGEVAPAGERGALLVRRGRAGRTVRCAPSRRRGCGSAARAGPARWCRRAGRRSRRIASGRRRRRSALPAMGRPIASYWVSLVSVTAPDASTCCLRTSRPVTAS